MKLIISVLATLVTFIASLAVSQAVPLKTYVSGFTVSGSANSAELCHTLQDILTSRLDSAQVQLVEKPDQAEILVSGSYALFGKMFSLDALVKNKGNGALIKVFEQGEGQENIIPAIGRLAGKISDQLAKGIVSAASAAPPAAQLPSPAVSQAIPPTGYVVKPEASQDVSNNWSSAPIEGVFTSMATGRTLSSGERELFVASERTIRAYLKGHELKPVAEISIPTPARILAIDTADLDKDGQPELYVTIMDREFPSSRVYSFDGKAFSLIAENQPWCFRGIGNDITSRSIFIQEMQAGTYYGPVKELVKSGNSFTAKSSQKLPRSGNIFNFSRLDNATAQNSVVLIEDGFLVIYSPDGTEAWKSSEQYGGSEKFFKIESPELQRSSGDPYRWTFLEQRSTLLKDGTLLVPRNEGTFNIGNNRSYSKYSLYAFDWTGAVLKEKWHTRTSPGYLADYAFDQTAREILLLEVVQKAGVFSKGKTVISIHRID